MWPAGKIPDKPVGTLYTYAKRIREALARMANPPRIHVGGGTYRVEVDRAEIDFFQFKALIETAISQRGQGDQEAAARSLSAAIALWSDQPLADLGGDSAEEWRVLTEQELVIPAHAELLSGLCTTGKFDEVLRRLSDLPTKYRTNLALIKCRLRALRGTHQHDPATIYYLDQRRRLLAEFDQDSADELTRYHDELRRRQDIATRPVSAVPHLLPHDIADFTGRAGLLDHLSVIMTRPVVAVLVGEPGVGKTALALHWAHQRVEQFPDGQFYVDLNGFGEGARTQPAEVIARFLEALGYSEDQIPTLSGRVARLRSLLSQGRNLVVLDNAGDAGDIRTLLDCFPTCTVIVTSRRRLSALRAVTVPVAPLSYGESKTLLFNRLGERAAGERQALGQLTALCGGIAMALRVVAEHVASRPRVPLADFAEELRDAHTLLSLGSDDQDPDGSVRAAFEHSYQSLGPAEQRLFRLLGFNPGSDIGIEAAMALSGQDLRQTRRGLDTLADACLLGQPESRDRYRFHDLLRKYAYERSFEDQPERRQAGERLLNFYSHSTSRADMLAFPSRDEVPSLALVDGVTPMSFADADSAIRWMVRERANLNAIVRYAAANDFHEYATRLPSSIGEIFNRLNYYDDAIAALEIAVLSAQAMRNTEREAISLGNLGFVFLTVHRLTEAEQCFRLAKQKSEDIGDAHAAAINDHRIGRLLIERGDFKEGIESLHLALSELNDIGEPGEFVIFRYRLGEAYRRAGNLAAAVSYCEASLAQAREIGDRRSEAVCMVELALTFYARGDLGAAKGACVHGLALCAEIHETSQPGRYYNLLALISRAHKNPREAERFAQSALQHSRAAKDAKTEAAALDTLAELSYAQARTEEALDFWSKALALYSDLEDPRAESVRARLADSMAFPDEIPSDRTAPLRGAASPTDFRANNSSTPPVV
ncbi:MAG: tetratricopeptide repeat protein [Kibdelosporangium sp.]